VIELERPPQNELRKPWSDWFFKVFLRVTSMQLPVLNDSNRGDAGNAGRIIFNTDDNQVNIDNGTDWTLSDGTTT
jgi:hypothetical protein